MVNVNSEPNVGPLMFDINVQTSGLLSFDGPFRHVQTALK